MAQGRISQQWNHTAEILAMLHNQWSEHKISADQIHPFRKPRRVVTDDIPITALKGVFGLGD